MSSLDNIMQRDLGDVSGGDIVGMTDRAFSTTMQSFMQSDEPAFGGQAGGASAPEYTEKVMENSNEMQKFQKAVHTYITSLTPSQQMLELPRIQQKTPFVLADPYRRMIGGADSVPKYTPQDMYYFLSDNFVKQSSNARNTGQDPFYQPILYPDDASVDQVLHHLIRESPYSKTMRLYDQYKNNRSNPDVYKQRIKNIYKILTDKSYVANPWYMTKFVAGQERPMETYRNNEFMNTLSQFTQKYASKPKVSIEKVTINAAPIEVDDEQLRILKKTGALKTTKDGTHEITIKKRMNDFPKIPKFSL